MVNRLLKTSYGWLKVMLVLVCFGAVNSFLLTAYGVRLGDSVVDSLVYVLLVFAGGMLLENIFRFYKPQKGNSWLWVGLPLLLGVVIVLAGELALKHLLESEWGYLTFLRESRYVRGVFVLMLFGAYTGFLIVGGQLEDQLEARRRTEMMDKLSKEAEMYHLRQQLQPHFLFNSLNSVSALVKRKPEQAREMILQLSEFLRGTIRKDPMEWVGVREEMKCLQLFLEIEKVRFGHRLEVDFFVEEETEKLMLPSLLIQPLLENAVKHGIYGRTDRVCIKILVNKIGNFLNIMISNPYDPEAVNSNGEGFGLESVKRRMYLLFGRHDLLKVKQSPELFEVNLSIPLTYDQNDNN
ncbi:histidine kinase [Echinicola strongylocentroti]|uniref:Histidine kinase n=1 Tax=Echinicola strongylocentroti TaxID=1795355 RepID=A0A2Z4IGK2_9BACT|nr:histidine kinase [Echinicola strongylocentroti]AWW29839.1 histidine kinase [Echinicola strongylocentroti]